MDNDLWEQYCELEGMSIWAVNEGMDEDDHLDISHNTAIRLALLSGELEPEEPEPKPTLVQGETAWTSTSADPILDIRSTPIDLRPSELFLSKKDFDRMSKLLGNESK